LKENLPNKLVISTLRRLFPHDPRNRFINVGGGNWYYPRWENIDLKADDLFVDYRMDLNEMQPLPFEDQTVTLIFSQNFIYYLTEEACDFFLKECYRIMRVPGIIRIGVADNLNPIAQEIQDTMPEVKSRYTTLSLKMKLKRAGFMSPRYTPPRESEVKTLRGFMFDRIQDYIIHVEAVKL